jgi:HD-GYP domain-containing protein (c-di-GMP phosphodiesterase class II)
VSKARVAQAVFVGVCVAGAFGSVRAAGGTASFEPQVQYIAIILAAVWFGPWGGALVGVLCGLLVGPLMPSNSASGTAQEVGAWLPRLVYFAGIGAAFGFMQERLRVNLRALRKTRDDLERRNAEILEAERRAEEEVRRLKEAHDNEAEALAEIGALSHLDAVVSAGQGEDAILDTIAEIVCQAIGAELGLVIYLNPVSKTLGVKALSGLHGESAVRMANAVRRLRMGRGLPWRAIMERQPVCDEPHAGEAATKGAGGCGIAAPLLDGEEPFGAVCAVWRHERRFAPADLERMGRLTKQASLAIHKARQHRIVEEVTFDTVLTLADAIEGRAAYTTGHVGRIVAYADIIARSLHIPEGEVRAIRYGAALHDVGMLGVPDDILQRPGRLTPEEMEQLRMHPYHGSRLCKRAGFLSGLTPIIYHHHERFDGKGYPEGLRGPAIPLGARIVAVADAYDAMTTERPYRQALSEEEAAEALRREAGHQLDPDIVDAFLEAMEERRRHRLAA